MKGNDGGGAAEGAHLWAEFEVPLGKHGRAPLWLDCSELVPEAADGKRKGIPQKLPPGLLPEIVRIGRPVSVTVTMDIRGREHVTMDGDRGTGEARQTVRDRGGALLRLLAEAGAWTVRAGADGECTEDTA